jgi:hypothetical protein
MVAHARKPCQERWDSWLTQKIKITVRTTAAPLGTLR